MKEQETKDLIASAMPEGSELPEGFDFAKVHQGLNTISNDYVAANKPDMDKVNAEAVNNLISGLGIQNVSDLNGIKTHLASLSSNVDDKVTTINDLTSRLTTATEESMTFKSQLEEANKKIIGYEQTSVLSEMQVIPEKLEEFKVLANAKITDELDFKGAAAQVAESNPSWIMEGMRKNIGSSQGGLGQKTPQGELAEMRAAFGLTD